MVNSDMSPLIEAHEALIKDNKELRWDVRFMLAATLVASWSKDPSSKVGAVAVNEQKIMFMEGFNGFPPGIADTEERLNNRELKYKYILHAEQNLVSNAASLGVSLKNSTVYVTGIPPCEKCALILIKADVARIVVRRSDIVNGRDAWIKSFEFSLELFAEAGIQVEVLEAM